jgi:hypothetical protein
MIHFSIDNASAQRLLAAADRAYLLAFDVVRGPESSDDENAAAGSLAQ